MLRLCRHCKGGVVNRPRQLCHRCYDEPTIRELYPPKATNKAKRSRRNRRLARYPTPALPGSPAKLLVMQQRWKQRVQLFHPLDATE